ncbi:MAG: hypothetical protein J3T61_11870 [Candidatus Brocadiales bacterium]|nr:hypothetical protein [Candidatus Bathyanammoxibius sp.]
MIPSEGDSPVIPTAVEIVEAAVLPPAKIESQRPGGQLVVNCEIHPDVEFRPGSFCEKCYSDKTLQRMMKLDEALDNKVLDQIDVLVQKILDADDKVLLERFLGRIMARFSRPSEHHVSGQLKALHLVAGVDFGKKQ